VFKFIRVILGMPNKSCCEKTYEETYESLSSEFNAKLEEAYSDLNNELKRTEETGLKGYEEAFAVIQDLRESMSVARADYDTLLERYNEIYKNYHGHTDKSITRSADPAKPRVEFAKLPDGCYSAADLETHSWGIRFTKQSGEVDWFNRKTNPRAPWGPIPTLLSEKEARARVLRYKTCIIAEELVGRGNWGIRYTHGNGQVVWWHHPVDEVAWGLSSDATVFTEEKAKEKAAYFISEVAAVQVLFLAAELSSNKLSVSGEDIEGEEPKKSWVIQNENRWYLKDIDNTGKDLGTWASSLSDAILFSKKEAEVKVKYLDKISSPNSGTYIIRRIQIKIPIAHMWGVRRENYDGTQPTPSWYRDSPLPNWTANIEEATPFSVVKAVAKAKEINETAGVHCCASKELALPNVAVREQESKSWAIQQISRGDEDGWWYFGESNSITHWHANSSNATLFSKEEAEVKAKAFAKRFRDSDVAFAARQVPKSHEEEAPEGWLIYYKEDKGISWYLTDPHCYSWRDEVSKAHVFSEEEAATKLKEVNRGRKEVKYFATLHKPSEKLGEPWVIQRNSTGNLYYKSKSGVVVTLDFISKAAVFSEEEAKAETKQLNSELTGEPYSAMRKEEKLRSNKSSKYERAKDWVIQRIQSDEQNFWFIRGKCTSTWTGSIRCATLFSEEDAKAKVLQLEPGALPSVAIFAHRVPKLDPVQKPEKQDKPSVEDEFLTDLKNMIG